MSNVQAETERQGGAKKVVKLEVKEGRGRYTLHQLIPLRSLLQVLL
jgi:hypothetical protein